MLLAARPEAASVQDEIGMCVAPPCRLFEPTPYAVWPRCLSAARHSCRLGCAECASKRVYSPNGKCSLSNALSSVLLALLAIPHRLPLDCAFDDPAGDPPSDELVVALTRANPLGGLHYAATRDSLSDFVFEVVSQNPGLAYQSADREGRPAINVATGLCLKLMRDAIFILGRYELTSADAPKHRSATCVVHFARDYGASTSGGAPAAAGQPQEVVLKFMRNHDQWQREIRTRGGTVESGMEETPEASSGERGLLLFSSDHVLPVLRAHVLTKEQAERLGAGLQDYLFILTLPKGEEDLQGPIARCGYRRPSAARTDPDASRLSTSAEISDHPCGATLG